MDDEREFDNKDDEELEEGKLPDELGDDEDDDFATGFGEEEEDDMM